MLGMFVPWLKGGDQQPIREIGSNYNQCQFDREPPPGADQVEERYRLHEYSSITRNRMATELWPSADVSCSTRTGLPRPS